MINNKSTYMTETKVAHLNSLGFIWTLRESKKPWTDWLEELRDYKKIHGHCDVPLKYEKNLPLGAFVNNQRSEYRKLLKGEPSSMNDAKIKDLEAMGFHWSVREGRTPWNARLAELLAYKDKYGDTNVPRNWEENPSLSIWVETVCPACASFVILMISFSCLNLHVIVVLLSVNNSKDRLVPAHLLKCKLITAFISPYSHISIVLPSL
jgi:hypothetical protein